MPERLPPIFDQVNDVDRATALRQFERRTVEAGAVVIREGQPARGLVCVLEGELAVRSGESTVGRVPAGDLVGEMALFEETERTASVVATEPSRLLVLRRKGYERLRDVMHPLGVALERHALELQMERMQRVTDRISSLALGQRAPFTRPTERFRAALAALFGGGGPTPFDAVEAAKVLRESTIFAGAPVEAMKAIARGFRPEAWGPGQLLCTEGETGETMYVLASGEVEVVVSTREERVQRLATLQPGAAFGQIALGLERPRMATCVANSRVVVLAMDKPAWRYLVEEPHLAGSVFRRALIRGMSEQIAHSNKLLAEFEAKARDTVEPLRRAGMAVDTYGPVLRRG